MLQFQAVQPKLLAGLKFLMTLPQLLNYRLVGGTALALLYGHRQSVDIDLFGSETINWESLEQELYHYSTPQFLSKSKAICAFLLEGVKVDVVRYNYPWLREPIADGELRLADPVDIAAMKLNAIAGRGVKKDFIDLNLLLDHFSLQEMLGYYQKKYQQESNFMVLKSLEYFDDADPNDDPEMLSPYHWEDIKKRITDEVKKLALG